MKTLMPAAPGRRSSSGISSAFSAVPPTQKAWSQCMRPFARASLSASASAVVVSGSGVGHLEDGGHAAHHRGERPGLQILLVLRAGLAEMHLAVDDAREDRQTRRIDDLAGVCRR